jgi:hypothetical protein
MAAFIFAGGGGYNKEVVFRDLCLGGFYDKLALAPA